SGKADNMAYMSVDLFPTSHFGTINLDTGAFSLLGDSGQVLGGFAVANGKLYATVLYTNDNGRLFTVNLADGSLTLVGTSGIDYSEFGSTTQGVYAVGRDGNLYAVDPATGAATLIGPTGVTLITPRAMSTNATLLYWGVGSDLYTVDT